MRQKDENKIEQIYKATLDLVFEKGLAGTTICDISKGAGIATGTLYIYFKNKEELINILFSVCREESARYYLKDYDESEAFEPSFRKIFNNIIDYRLLKFKDFIFLEQCYHSPFIEDALRQKSLQSLQSLFQLIERGVKQGLVRDLNKHVILSFLMGIINEAIKNAHYGGKKLDGKSVNILYELCWNGIKK